MWKKSLFLFPLFFCWDISLAYIYTNENKSYSFEIPEGWELQIDKKYNKLFVHTGAEESEYTESILPSIEISEITVKPPTWNVFKENFENEILPFAEASGLNINSDKIIFNDEIETVFFIGQNDSLGEIGIFMRLANDRLIKVQITQPIEYQSFYIPVTQSFRVIKNNQPILDIEKREEEKKTEIPQMEKLAEGERDESITTKQAVNRGIIFTLLFLFIAYKTRFFYINSFIKK